MELDAVSYLRFVAALAFVIGLMLALLWALRRFGPAGMVVRPGVKRRLGVVETAALDGRRRLVLVRRDEIEHLLLIGGSNDLLIESRIVPGTGEDKA